MARFYLIRHGEAAAGWNASTDPGLSPLGEAQAGQAAKALAEDLAPLPIQTSPMRRCRETAAPLEQAWATKAAINPHISEIRSPTDDLEERSAWLKQLIAGTWAAADAVSLVWRADLLGALLSIKTDTVLYSHFVAINAAAGAAAGDDRVLIFRPNNCSINLFSNDGGQLKLLARGSEAETRVR